jgi:TM2 domain-containing membrane protein YozV
LNGSSKDGSSNRLRVVVACVLAWLIPGAGHFYLGKRSKGLVFLAIVAVTFLTGLALQGRVYLATPEQPLSYLATFANLALGPMDLIGREATYERIIYVFPRESDRANYQDILDRTRARILAVTHEYGTTFILTAGLMNLLLILDAFDFGIGRKI